MVKFVYRKTMSFWSRIIAVIVSLFSFSSISRAETFQKATATNLDNLSSAYTDIVNKIEALQNKISVLKTSGGSDSLLSLQNEIDTLKQQASTIQSGVTSLRSQVSAALNKVPALKSSSYNF